jgi:hypothetical protein
LNRRREASVFGYLTFVPYFGAAAVLIGVIGLVLSRRRTPQQPKPKPDEVVSDWRPTGKIDFCQSGAGDSPLFYLQTEEYRVLQSMSGTKHVEVRWRHAMLEEAKRVASWNNSRAAILDLPLPESIRSATLVPNLAPPEPIAGGDEHDHMAGRPH